MAEKESINLSSGITGDNPMKPARRLFENGKWMVPIEERPKGWETMNMTPFKPRIDIDVVDGISRWAWCLPDGRKELHGQLRMVPKEESIFAYLATLDKRFK